MCVPEHSEHLTQYVWELIEYRESVRRFVSAWGIFEYANPSRNPFFVNQSANFTFAVRLIFQTLETPVCIRKVLRSLSRDWRFNVLMMLGANPLAFFGQEFFPIE